MNGVLGRPEAPRRQLAVRVGGHPPVRRGAGPASGPPGGFGPSGHGGVGGPGGVTAVAGLPSRAAAISLNPSREIG